LYHNKWSTYETPKYDIEIDSKSECENKLTPEIVESSEKAVDESVSEAVGSLSNEKVVDESVSEALSNDKAVNESVSEALSNEKAVNESVPEAMSSSSLSNGIM